MSHEPVREFLGLRLQGDFLGPDTELYGLKKDGPGFLFLISFVCVSVCLSLFRPYSVVQAGLQLVVMLLPQD